MAIFQKSVIKKHLANLDKEQVDNAYLKFQTNYKASKIHKIKTLKEEEYQDGFLRDIFVDVFGYTLKPEENYTLVREFKNQSDGKKADAAIVTREHTATVTREHAPLRREKAIAVIELKSTKTKDLYKVTQQAFNYKNNQPECKYVITSNFQKLRFYIDYANEYEEFDLFNLQKKDFELLYLILNKESIFDNLPIKLKEETKFHEQEVSDKLYKDYSHFKTKLYENLTKNHPEQDKLILFKKSQKLIDRFLFILFAEDSGLLPPNSISRVIDTFNKLEELDAYKPIYEIFKQYFGYMNKGRKGKTPADDIPAYNGGLFYTDKLLDKLKIDDKVLIDDLKKLSTYDFSTEVDVNILGHIFEHSLSEIEEITAEIEATAVATREHAPLRKEKTISKRKKDGVFYTPKYITQYIVENTVGTLCHEKRQELQLEEIEFDGTYKAKGGKLSAKGKKLFKTLEAYKNWLQTLKIIDPACGSGAFLNQALNFLITEHKTIDDIIAELTNTPMRLFDVDKSILENNLFGVDINEESVEIAQLSLWLRTAQKGRKLSSLNNNIKCGNSLIDDPTIAGDKAFRWQTEFPQIFKEKDKKIYHITTAIHDSRTSARMKKYKVRERRDLGTNPYPNIIYFTKEDDLLITQTIAKIVKEDKLNMLAYNICADHLHLLLVCDIHEVPSIMQKIKSITSKVVSRLHDTREHATLPHDTREHATLPHDTREHATLTHDTREHAPLHKKKKPLWQQKYSPPKEVTSQDQLQNTLSYIQKNRSKHELPEHSKEIKLLIENMCVDFETAIKPEYTGGFDCVIGNPPYFNIQTLGAKSKIAQSIQNSYPEIWQDKSDILFYFIAKAIQISKNNVGFIVSNAFMFSDKAKKLRNYILENAPIEKIINFEKYMVFQDASITTNIIKLNKNRKDTTCLAYAFKERKYTQEFVSQTINNPDNYFKVNLKKDNVFALVETEIANLNEKIDSNYEKLSKIFKIGKGMETAANKQFLFKEYPSQFPKEFIKKRMSGEMINQYHIDKVKEYILYFEQAENFEDLPKSIQNHLIENREFLEKRATVKNEGRVWWRYSRPMHKDYYNLDKIWCSYRAKDNIFCFDNTQEYIGLTNTTVIFDTNKEINLKYLLALLNSSTLNFRYKSIGKQTGSGVYEYFENGVGKLPIPQISKAQQLPIIELVDTITENKQKQADYTKLLVKTKAENNFEREIQLEKELEQIAINITQTDNEIDKMVYELYGLNDSEIAIIEKSV